MSDDAVAGMGRVDWAAIVILAPLAASALAFVFPRRSPLIGLSTSLAAAFASVTLVARVATEGAYRHAVSGWGAPLGIELAADGLSAALLAMTNLVGLGVGLQAVAAMGAVVPASREPASAGFWPLWLLLLGGMNALYLSTDVFNLYVTLEIVSLAAVGLATLSARPEALQAAMRYLLVGVVGSLLYLLGVTLLYGAHGVLDIARLHALIRAEPASGVPMVAMAAMFSALAIKSALFPLHVWLPPAHGHAIAPVSALLSALVVKASAYMAARLWLDLFPPAVTGTDALATTLGVLGACAVAWGAIQALMTERLKLLAAYSTVTQIGYLFLCFPLWGTTRGAVAAFVYLAVAHAFAKSAFFLACGRVQSIAGDDRLASLPGTPLPAATKLTFGLAAISLVGLPPSGGFVGKWFLLDGSLSDGLSGWSVVIVAGTLLSAAAMVRMFARFFTPDSDPPGPARPASVPDGARRDLIPLMLAAASIALGFLGTWPSELVASVERTR